MQIDLGRKRHCFRFRFRFRATINEPLVSPVGPIYTLLFDSYVVIIVA